MFIDFILKRAWVAILKNHNFEISILETLVTFKDVWTVEFHHDFRLFFSEPLFYRFQFRVSLTFYCSQIEYFNGNLFILRFIDSSINLGKGSLTYHLKNDILLNFDPLKRSTISDIVDVKKVKFWVSRHDLFLCNWWHLFRLNTFYYCFYYYLFLFKICEIFVKAFIILTLW